MELGFDLISLDEFDDFPLAFDALFPFPDNPYRDNDTFILQIVDIELILMSDIGLIVSAIFPIQYRQKSFHEGF